jgi:hypothetical protein
MKNVGYEGTKPLKMEKMLIIENLSMRRYLRTKFNDEGVEIKDIVLSEERINAMNFKLI